MFLTCVANGNIYMSHDAIDGRTEGRTIECSPPPTGARQRSRGCRHGAIARISTVAPSGLSVSRRGGCDRPPGSSHGTVDTYHVVDSRRRSARSAQLFGRQRINTWRDCSACHLELPKGSAQAWLRAAREGIAGSVSITHSIACSPANYSMSTKSLFQTKYVSSVVVLY